MPYGREVPEYASFDPPEKFAAIESIVARHLWAHPKAVVSYSGGSDSDIVLSLVERVREAFRLPPVDYEFLNTGFELAATRDHVREAEARYGISVEEVRPRRNVVMAVREVGLPLFSKVAASRIESWQRDPFPLEWRREYLESDDRPAYYRRACESHPKQKGGLQWVLGCDSKGEPRDRHSQFNIACMAFLWEYMVENPPDFKVSARCCKVCKERPLRQHERGYDMVVTGERKSEGGMRSVGSWGCFGTSGLQYRLRPLYFVTDADKEWYREAYGIEYSRAYTKYGFRRVGCTGCPFNSRAAEDLALLDEWEPNLARAARNVFGKSYDYRAGWWEFKESMKLSRRIEGKGNIYEHGL